MGELTDKELDDLDALTAPDEDRDDAWYPYGALRECVANVRQLRADRQRVSGAVRELIARLPRCTYAKSPYLNAPIAEWIICTHTATRGSPRGPTLCDEHGATTGESNYAPALRAVLAMLDGDKRLAASVVADHATTHTAKVERVVEAARSAAEKLDAEVCAYIGISSRLHMERALDAAEELRAAVKALDGEGGEGR